VLPLRFPAATLEYTRSSPPTQPLAHGARSITVSCDGTRPGSVLSEGS